MARLTNTYVKRWRSTLIVMAIITAILVIFAAQHWNEMLPLDTAVPAIICASTIAATCFLVVAGSVRRYGKVPNLSAAFACLCWSVIIYWGLLYSLLVCINCYFDSSAPTTHRATVVAIDDGPSNSPGDASSHRIVHVASWHAGPRTIALPTGTRQKLAVRVGEEILVTTKAGTLGMEYVVAQRAPTSGM